MAGYDEPQDIDALLGSALSEAIKHIHHQSAVVHQTQTDLMSLRRLLLYDGGSDLVNVKAFRRRCWTLQNLSRVALHLKTLFTRRNQRARKLGRKEQGKNVI